MPQLDLSCAPTDARIQAPGAGSSLPSCPVWRAVHDDLNKVLHGNRGATNIHANGTDTATGALRFSWIGDREGRVFTSPPELFTPRSRAA